MDRRVPRAQDRLAPDRRLVAPTGPTERRRLLLAAALAILPFIALAVWARVSSPAPWEPHVLAATALGEGPAGDFFRLINSVGNLGPWSVLVAVAGAGFGLVRGARAALLVGLSLAGDLAAFAVKLVVERQRPESAATELLFGPETFAFPSGHVVRAVALAAALAWVLAPAGWRFRVALVAGAGMGLLMGYARVALGVHWPTDALGGALLGLAWFALTAWTVTPRQQAAQTGATGAA